MSTWSELALDPRLLKAIATLGWQKPTAIQVRPPHLLFCRGLKAGRPSALRDIHANYSPNLSSFSLSLQEHAITQALQGKDVLARARTGSGKTAAYALPLLSMVLKKQVSSGPQSLSVSGACHGLCAMAHKEKHPLGYIKAIDWSSL